jgi:aspartyl protease family protein
MLRAAVLIAFVSIMIAGFGEDIVTHLEDFTGSTPQRQTQFVSKPRSGVQTAKSDPDMNEAVVRADSNGQYVADVVINGISVTMLIDTGATSVALSAQTASRLGLMVVPGDYTARVRTAAGVSMVAPVTLSTVRVGDVEVAGVQALVLSDDAGDVNLLGMSYLRRLGSVEQQSGKLILRR